MPEKPPIQLFNPVICDESIAAVEKVLRSGWIGLGPVTKLFEKEFAEYLGVPADRCVALNSCTAALHLAFVLAGIGQGEEVYTTANTFVSTNHAIRYVGSVPVFCDIELGTGNIDADAIPFGTSCDAYGVVAVHLAGYPADISEIMCRCAARNMVFIEDCAHAMGAEYLGKKAGTFGDYACFSFHAVKNLPAGDGGMLVCKNADDAARARRLRWLGIDKDTISRTDNVGKLGSYAFQYDVPEIGFKYHMNDITAAIALEQLRRLDQDNAKRAEIAQIYMACLSGCAGLRLPEYDKTRKSSYHFLPVLVKDRDALITKLKSENIHPGVHYIRNDMYAPYEKADLPNTQCWTEHELSLPMHLALTDDDIERVCSAIIKGW